MAKLENIHPGDVLREDFLAEMNITPYRLAKDTGLSQTHIGDILRGERSVTAATALRLAAYFGTSAQFWLNLQNAFDIEQAQSKLSNELAQIPNYSQNEPAAATK